MFFVLKLTKRLRLFSLVIFHLVLFLLWDNSKSFMPVISPSEGLYLSIIIDDCTGTAVGMEDFLSIPAPLTLAFLPYGENNHVVIEKAHNKGFEIFLHLAMEPNIGKPSWLGPYPITVDLSEEEIKNRTKKAIENIPHIKGVNNHMGSKATADRRVITAVMEVVRDNELIFVDSRTTPRSVIPELAKDFGVTFYERDIFLEEKGITKENIKKQLRFAINSALKDGKTISIGHAGVEGGRVTALAIKEMLPEIEKAGITIVKISDLKTKSLKSID